MNTKKNYLKLIFTIAISVVVAAFFMWIALRGINFTVIKEYFSNANYFWVIISALLALLAYWFRAIRWNLLLEPMGYSISTSYSLWSISFGYLINLTIPRFGEIARATALFKVEEVPVDKSFGTIILERVVDLLCMMIFLCFTLILKYDAILTFYRQSDINIPLDKMAILGILIILGGSVFFILRDKLKHLPVIGKIVNIFGGITKGILSIFKLKQPIKFIAYSLCIWGAYYLSTYLICFAIEGTSEFTFADGFYLVVVGTLGMMIPASGGIGAFHFALKLGIGALFLSMGKSVSDGEEVGLAYAFISHTMQLIIMVVMGLIAIPILAKAKKIKN